MRLSDFTGKSHNLQLCRFLAALLVIVSHAFALSRGDNRTEWLFALTKGQTTLGAVAVDLFFLCGGYLAVDSVRRYPARLSFLGKRLQRLLPPLALVVAVCIGAGALFSELPAASFFTDPGTWRYALNALMLPVHTLPGVFARNAYGPTVNGALWTLPVEFACFCACFLAHKLHLFEEKKYWLTAPAAAAGVAALFLLGRRYPILSTAAEPIALFYVGTLYNVCRAKVRLSGWAACAAAAGTAVLFALGAGRIGMILLLPYALMFLWFGGVRQIPARLGAAGELSYFMYLWGFPVQQALVDRSGGSMSPYVNMLAAAAIDIVLAAACQALFAALRRSRKKPAGAPEK